MDQYQDDIEEDVIDEEEGDGEGDYEDTFAELNRKVASRQDSVHSRHSHHEELDALEYSQDVEEEYVDTQHPTHQQQPSIEEEEDDEEEETDDDEDAYSEDEDGREQTAEVSAAAQQKTAAGSGAETEGKQHLYENKFTKPVLKLGKTTVSVGEARLFGLLDKDGNVKVPSGAQSTGRSKAEAKEAMAVLSRQKKDPKDLPPPEAVDEDKKECRFQPQRSKQAARAMRNPSCGYDFVTRLEEKGGFMERNGGNPEPKADDRSEKAKEDYEASLNKLQCPSCRKFQSFDEYVEKRRSCGPCRERYQQLNVVNMGSWKHRQQQAERKKQERLRKIEEEFYGDVSFAPKLNKTGPGGQARSARSKQLSLTERTAAVAESRKAEVLAARAEKEKLMAEQEQRRRVEAAAARVNRAAAAKREQEGGAGGRGAASSTSSSSRPKHQQRQHKPPPYSEEPSSGQKGGWNQTAPASGLPHTGNTGGHSRSKGSKPSTSSFNKTTNNISAKFDMLLN